MTIAALTSSTLLLGTAWTGTAPGTGSAPSGTINSGSGTYIDITSYTQEAGADFSVNVLDGTTFGSGGYQLNYAGLKSGSLTLTVLADFASGANMEKLWAMFGSTVYFDLKPTSSSRSTSNGSAVGAVVVNSLKWVPVKVGELPMLQLTWPTSGAYTVLTS